MSLQAASAAGTSPQEIQSRIARGRQVLLTEQAALRSLCESLDAAFSQAVDKLLACRGSVVVTGMGKAGIVGQKISASLASTGTPSHFLHPAEAVHGDLGRVRPEDCVLLLSASGETEEIIRILPALRERAATTLAITCRGDSRLATQVDLVLLIGQVEEACSLGLAPTTSTILMMALGDALALVTSDCRGFTSQQFAAFHPAGSLGKRLTSVRELMRPLSQCRVASAGLSVREVIVQVSRPGRRTGAIMLTDASGQLVGIFTDSDLARLLERDGSVSGGTGGLEQPISQVMSRRFQTIQEDCLFPEAARVLSEFKISELPVVDRQGRALGIIDITDLFGTAMQAGAEDGQAEDSMSPTPTSRNKTASRKTRLRASPSSNPMILPLERFRRDPPE